MATVYDPHTGVVVWDSWALTNVTYTNSSTNVEFVWTGWTTGASSTPLAVGGVVHPAWGNWVTETTVSTPIFAPPPPLTEEQLEARRVQREQAEQLRQQRLAEREAAQQRARELLLDALEDEQRDELLREGYFHVETRDGTRRYRLSPTGQPRRVFGEDGRQWSYCIHPDMGYPGEDVALAQKLLLEADEEEFLRIANARPLVCA